jgi:hypothetical protein
VKVCYIERRFHSGSRKLIQQANDIIHEYTRAGYVLTLRQLYYQFVARGFIPNKQSEYNRLGSLINDARLAGQIDWHAVEDRTRNLERLSTWDNPEDMISAAFNSYRENKWETQPVYVEVWVEKEALAGVVEHAAEPLEVPYFSCRGYVSQSEMFSAAQRFISVRKPCVVIHLGDHDPSGIDMTRDIIDRMNVFEAYDVTVERIALNYDQIERYNPPPNPAKETDSRFETYMDKFGEFSWELDALEPQILNTLIQDTILKYRDDGLWQEAETAEAIHKKQLGDTYYRWEEVVGFLDGGEEEEEEE